MRTSQTSRTLPRVFRIHITIIYCHILIFCFWTDISGSHCSPFCHLWCSVFYVTVFVLCYLCQINKSIILGANLIFTSMLYTVLLERHQSHVKRTNKLPDELEDNKPKKHLKNLRNYLTGICSVLKPCANILCLYYDTIS